MARLKKETEVVGYPILPLVRQLAAQCGEAGKLPALGRDHAGHHGHAPSCCRCATRWRSDRGRSRRPAQALARSGASDRDTPMAGRTHLQQALPITFGYKAAVWLAMSSGTPSAWSSCGPRVLVASSAARPARSPRSATRHRGARGADAGAEARAARRSPGTSRATASPRRSIPRPGDRVARQDRHRRHAADVDRGGRGQRALRAGARRGSTMPQKRNPISSELILACAKAVRQHAGLMLDAMVQDYERATGPWHAEWIALPEAFIARGGRAAAGEVHARRADVDEARMRQEPRHDPWPHRRRGGDDGARARSSAATRRTTSSTTPAARP